MVSALVVVCLKCFQKNILDITLTLQRPVITDAKDNSQAQAQLRSRLTLVKEDSSLKHDYLL